MRLRAFLLLAALGVSVAPADADAPDPRTVREVLLPEIRTRFHQAVEGPEATEALIAFIRRHFSDDPSRYPPTVVGYYASLEGLRGKHETNLFRKFHLVTDAIATMDPLVAAHPQLLEVRFLRFSFYEQIPAVFGVHHHVPEDLARLVEMLGPERLAEVPVPVQLDMIDHILATDEPTAEQRLRLEETRRQLWLAGPTAEDTWEGARRRQPGRGGERGSARGGGVPVSAPGGWRPATTGCPAGPSGRAWRARIALDKSSA